MINDLPTIFEVVSGNVKQPKDQSATHNNSGKSKSSAKMVRSYELRLISCLIYSNAQQVIFFCCLDVAFKQSRQPEALPKSVKVSPPPKGDDDSGDDGEDDDEQGATCGACGESYGTDEFWICCDMCERWFHGKCVKITPAKAEHIKQYKCPSCSGSKRARV